MDVNVSISVQHVSIPSIIPLFAWYILGQVGKFVLTQLKTVANDETHYRDLLGRSMDDEIQIIDLPREWHCNVIDGKRRRRQKLHR